MGLAGVAAEDCSARHRGADVLVCTQVDHRYFLSACSSVAVEKIGQSTVMAVISE